ncbi:MAG: protein-methionine-sulfoxide reductase catalytic subunit MsrP [Gammaproteobacteria bacterium]|nr:protein-methionine-sulfoxide reductase catalytic subunit MsrP [Gammaproteobacteria bacterium]MAY03422.1 protein-methionine-sulfoxide reductase catalytic subunit MsrP [Gammaproteobacteria bacterium]|tara:strand:- start:2338 stop:3378 length:1041 start_codon:yes stop_codon:yes gene_type:complete
MLIKTRKPIPSSEITPESVYRSRRDFIKGSMNLAVGAGMASSGLLSPVAMAQDGSQPRTAEQLNLASKPQWLANKVAESRPAPDSGPYTTNEMLTPYNDVTTYNNFYEFGTGKSDPSRNAEDFQSDPWSVEITGEVNRPGTYTLEDILRPHTFEERIYRLRCVEAWSMVIPWIGFPLGDLLSRFEPTGNANFVEFETLVDPQQFSEQRSRFALIDWPYREGLRMDEAMHPLTIMAVGLYNDILPAQNGAPLRLIVPWKYGIKSIKSIVKINFRRDMPPTTWNDIQANEYGFYSNVNPNVSHPRWSQATERRLPSGLFDSRIETQMFNGYADEVAHLYAGMDLRVNY